jgi:hypothetical protein
MNLIEKILKLLGLNRKQKTTEKVNNSKPHASQPVTEPTKPVEPASTQEEKQTETPPAVEEPVLTQQINTQMENYLILREPDRSKQTLGTFTISKNNAVVFTCKTIELPWKNNERSVSCIPDGVYRTIRHRSPSYGECFWILNVPGRSEILIHHGNYAASINPKTGTPDTKGCILPGEAHADVNADGIPDVTSSVNTMKKLREILPDEFQLEVRTKTG